MNADDDEGSIIKRNEEEINAGDGSAMYMGMVVI